MVLSCALVAAVLAQPLPVVKVTADDTKITASCRLEFPDAPIADANGNGVVIVDADDIIIEFAPGSALRGAVIGENWDRLTGCGVRIAGHRNVTLRGVRVHGYKAGIWATDAQNLTIDGADLSDNYRAHLKSTPQAEDGADWLYPHHNDENEWLRNYGAALYIEDSKGVTLRNVLVRRGQNGIVLDRVSDSFVYDNDCSFLSGWGLAMWRSGGNLVSRNAFDFCVRGHSEGVYNRGQDSAGILMFEQCSNNVIAENSATHGGDCFFGFAGSEAIGEGWFGKERDRLRASLGAEGLVKERNRLAIETKRDWAKKTDDEVLGELVSIDAQTIEKFRRKGNNDNTLMGNDFSYAPAHGIEMTFSYGNKFIRNRLVENAICAVWGGYSQETLIAENTISGNGGMAYGLERGGVNIEHGAGNVIVGNTFLNNRCGVHFWWNNGSLLKLPGIRATYRGVTGNVIAGNSFAFDDQHPFKNLQAPVRCIVLQLRDEGAGHVTGNTYAENTVTLPQASAGIDVVELDVKQGCEPAREGKAPMYMLPSPALKGERTPVGAREGLRGRANIIMTPWGPWDHESPLMRRVNAPGSTAMFEVLGVKGKVSADVVGEGARVDVHPGAGANSRIVEVTAKPGVADYTLHVTGEGLDQTERGTLISATWNATFFTWTKETDPREHPDEWRRLMVSKDAVVASVPAINFAYGMGGPRDLHISEEVTKRGPDADHFGMIATTKLPLPKGKWRFKTLSDDGVRVSVNSKPIIENWKWHGPETNEGLFEQTADGMVSIAVEHFEIDGYAVLKLEIEKVP